MGWLSEVADPEIPVLSITDLGIVRDVDCSDGVTVSVAPTYSGCPATEVIEALVAAALEERGVDRVRVKRVLSPPWTTDWITPEGREKLRLYGIAPPERRDSRVGVPGERIFSHQQRRLPDDLGRRHLAAALAGVRRSRRGMRAGEPALRRRSPSPGGSRGRENTGATGR